MTWEFYTSFCDEAFVVVDPLWLDANDMSPVGLNLAALTAAQYVVNARPTPPPASLAA